MMTVPLLEVQDQSLRSTRTGIMGQERETVMYERGGFSIKTPVGESDRQTRTLFSWPGGGSVLAIPTTGAQGEEEIVESICIHDIRDLYGATTRDKMMRTSAS
jgi:hypothetical protein